jgi:predicted DNA-binding protein
MIKDKYITVRVSPDTHQQFMAKAVRYGKPSEVLREIVEALLDDRLVIKPNPSKESLYVTRT